MKNSITRSLRSKENPFVAISKATFLNSDLTSTETVLLTYLLSFKDDWQFYKKNIKANFLKRFSDVSVRSFEAAFKGLQAKKYLRIKRLNTKGFHYQWRVFEEADINSDIIKNIDQSRPPALRSFAYLHRCDLKQEYNNNKNNKQHTGAVKIRVATKSRPQATTSRNVAAYSAATKIKNKQRDPVDANKQFLFRGNALKAQYQKQFQILLQRGTKPLLAAALAKKNFSVEEQKIIDLLNSPGYLDRLGLLDKKLPTIPRCPKSSNKILDFAKLVNAKRSDLDDQQYLSARLKQMQQSFRLKGDYRHIAISKIAAEILHHAKHFMPKLEHKLEERMRLNINIALNMLEQGKWSTPRGMVK